MRKTYFVANLCWLALALGVCWEAADIKVGSLRAPGPGFLPFWAGALLAVLSLISLAQDLRAKDDQAAAWSRGSTKWLPLVLLMAALFAYAFLLEDLGFVPCTFLLMLLAFRLIHPYPWWQVGLFSLATTGLTRLVFVTLLDSRLPKGWLGF